MSGHSKWATIKRKKAANDAAKGKAFTKIIKEITIAARDGGGDPAGNPRLRLAIDSAKASNMPQDNITRAIKKGTGELEGVRYEEINYEAYAPHGIAVILECVTDNRNRTVAELRHMISKYGGNLGESGSVAWMFERKGVILVQKENHTEDDLMEIVIDSGGDDLLDEGEFFEILSTVQNFETVRKTIESKGYKIESASLSYIAKDLVAIDEKASESILKFLEIMEEHDDVQNVYSNADFK